MSAGMSASTTLTSTKFSKVSNTTGTTFHIAVKAVVQTQTKTDLEPTLSRQHPVAMVELTTDRLSSADTKTKLVDCAVQVAVKTANKSVNAHQEFANFRYDKQTQATDYINNCLSDEEEAKFVWDGKERGWFILDNLGNLGKPNMRATYHTRQVILFKMHTEKYARSNGMGARLLTETYAKGAAERENALIQRFKSDCKFGEFFGFFLGWGFFFGGGCPLPHFFWAKIF